MINSTYNEKKIKKTSNFNSSLILAAISLWHLWIPDKYTCLISHKRLRNRSGHLCKQMVHVCARQFKLYGRKRMQNKYYQ